MGDKMRDNYVYFANNEKVREFILRFLATLSKEEVRRINRNELTDYIVYLMNDGRYDYLMRLLKQPSKKIDNTNAYAFTKKAIKGIIKSNYCRSVNTKEGEVLILDEKTLARYRRTVKMFADDHQNTYNKIVDDWKYHKKPRERKMSKNGVSLILKAALPNDSYTLCTEERKGLFGFFLPQDKTKIKRWDLFTDGNVIQGPVRSAFGKKVLTLNPRDFTEEDLKARQVKDVIVKSADFVAMRGYVGDTLTSAYVYTPLSGKKLDSAISIITDPSKEEIQVADEAPYVKTLGPKMPRRL